MEIVGDECHRRGWSVPWNNRTNWGSLRDDNFQDAKQMMMLVWSAYCGLTSKELARLSGGMSEKVAARHVRKATLRLACGEERFVLVWREVSKACESVQPPSIT